MQQYHSDIYPMLEQYCYDCHMDGSDKGKLDLDKYPDLTSMRKSPKVWEHILARVDYHLMPPPNKKQPDPAEREKLVNWITDAVFPIDPNRPISRYPVIRRLNRIEYQNTIRDLLSVEIDASKILPADDSGYGFDNIGSVLTISPAHIEKYLLAAETALDKALVLGPTKTPLKKLKTKDFKGEARPRQEGLYFIRNGESSHTIKIDHKGDYILRIAASGKQAGGEPAKLVVSHNGKIIETHAVTNSLDDEKIFTTKLKLRAQSHLISLGFSNDYYNPEAKNPRQRDRNLMVHSLHLEGPLGFKQKKPKTHQNIFLARKTEISDAEYARNILQNFMPKAFRRPISTAEIDRYMSLFKHMRTTGSNLEHSIYGTLQAILISPSFLYIAPPENLEKNFPSRVSEHVLASRLSYFLWSSMPDDELMQLAHQGKLRTQLDQQVIRMLKSDKSKEMIRHFSGQWLQLRDLAVITPNRKRFPTFTTALAQDMRTETEMLTNHILRGNKSLLEFLDAEYSFINNRLASHYSIPKITGSHFRRVELKNTKRRGILTHASLLTITSQPNRTSPVLRGKFVLENILDITPPPPPPLAESFDDKHNHNRTLREQLSMHRKKAACAGCHNLMDPVGLAFEHYDAIGRFREFENGQPIDASGKLVTGETLENADSLRQIIATKKSDEFLQCLTSKMLTYALGRGVDRYDRITVENILRDLKNEEYRAHSLILSIIKSAPFQQQGMLN